MIDAAIQASFDRESLFPRRGKEVHYTVNGKNRVTRGEYGESATITVNGENVDINHAIKANDEIIMRESTQGRPAQVRISDLLDYHGKISVTVDGQELTLAKPIKVNGREETSDYLIQEGDEVSLYSYYTYGQMYDYLKLNSKQKLTVNGREANEESAIYAGDKLEIQVKEEKQTQMHDANEPEKEVKPETVQVFKDMVEQAAKEEKQEEETISDNKSIVVIANQKPVTLAGKDSYQFVDIFDYIDFDTRTVKGKGIVTRVNGENAQYTHQLKDGDKL